MTLWAQGMLTPMSVLMEFIKVNPAACFIAEILQIWLRYVWKERRLIPAAVVFHYTVL